MHQCTDFLSIHNDVVVHPDGHIWFTDPGYGILVNCEGHKAEFELQPLPEKEYSRTPVQVGGARAGRAQAPCR